MTELPQPSNKANLEKLNTIETGVQTLNSFSINKKVENDFKLPDSRLLFIQHLYNTSIYSKLTKVIEMHNTKSNY